jgi:uncharacterized membrane protein
LNGVGLIVPVVVTLYVPSAAFRFIFAALNPYIEVLQRAGLIEGIRRIGVVQFLLRADAIVSPARFATELISRFVLAAVVVAVGMLARVGPGEQLIALFDRLISSVPGVGSVYMAFRRMSDAMLESEAQNFQDVKLVEFPRRGATSWGSGRPTRPTRSQKPPATTGWRRCSSRWHRTASWAGSSPTSPQNASPTST